MLVTLLAYHIPKTSLQGENFHKSVENTIYVGTGCSLVAPKDATPPHFAEKTSQIATKPQKSQNFSCLKVSCYTVVLLSHCFQKHYMQGMYREKTINLIHYLSEPLVQTCNHVCNT